MKNKKLTSKEAMRQLASFGGKATLRKHGKGHFKKMAQKSLEARKIKNEKSN